MPPKAKDKGDNPTLSTRPGTRRRNNSISIPEELQDIKDSHEGRKFLEKFSLLCPPGEPATNTALSMCLHQISGIAGVPKQAVNAIRATAFLLEELEEIAINDTIREAFDNHITEFTADMKTLVDDVNTKIDDHLKGALEQITKAGEKVTPGRVVHLPAIGNTQATRGASSYASALINPPPHANPRLAAKEGIKARQFLLTGIKESAIGHYDTQQLKDEINKKLREMDRKEGRIRSVLAQRDGNTLIEVDSDELANWLADTVNRVELCSILGDDIAFKMRSYSVLAMNVPLNLESENEDHREEINTVNGWKERTISAMRWAKPIYRRSPNQRSAHLILSFTDPEAANRAIAYGIMICNKKCHAERIKREPLRCLKCQGWNHMAKDCTETKDTCSNCAEDHRTNVCPNPRKTRCVSCKSNGHASWSRECQIFRRKIDEFNERNPENMLPFFPTNDPWTWSGDPADVSTHPAHKQTHQKNEKGKERERHPSSEPYRNCDTYFPNYNSNSDWTNPIDSNTTNPRQQKGWWDDDMPTSQPSRPTDGSQRPSQARNTSNNGSGFTFVNNGGVSQPNTQRPSTTDAAEGTHTTPAQAGPATTPNPNDNSTPERAGNA